MGPIVTALPQAALPSFTRVLTEERSAGILRFSTAGSVDDGKSTLIGRLLYDSQAVYEDQLDSVRKSRVNRSGGPIDFALLTDGLRAEREQGITIDVAYRYFATSRRKFIIADTPGHEQYTKNMATGTSTADAAVMLIDARKGILPQTRRHAYIASLLGVRHIVAAVNKMDLVGYSREAFERIAREFSEFTRQLGIGTAYAVPISALHGDNVVQRSAHMPWFESPPLLEYLETLPNPDYAKLGPLRFPVQCVVRPDANFRGYAGQVASGIVKPGKEIMVLPSGCTSRVKSIVTYEGELAEALPPMSVTLCLEDELDVGRGDMFVDLTRPPCMTQNVDAYLVWMHEQPLRVGCTYLLKHTTHLVRASVKALHYGINIDTQEKQSCPTLALNDIGKISISVHQPLFCDPYSCNRSTGSFILIDPITDATVAAGMVANDQPRAISEQGARDRFSLRQGRVSRMEHELRTGHRAITVWIENGAAVACQLERILFEASYSVHLFDQETAPYLAELCHALNDTGVIAIIGSNNDEELERTRRLLGEDNFIAISLRGDAAALKVVVNRVCEFLGERSLLSDLYKITTGDE